MSIFKSARILLPRTAEMEKWAVIACDQFTSQPDYWERVEQNVGSAPSTLRLFLPEAALNGDYEQRIPAINAAMEDYLRQGVFQVYPNAFIYVERHLLDGSVRRGLVGRIDLEQYDYSADAISPVRATERTVVERIPPRKKIREKACLELPHVLLLCDDERDAVLSPLTATKETLPLLYSFELMEGGGAISGRLVQGKAAEDTQRRLEDYARRTREKYAALGQAPLLYAVGDGNHSLATAKACWEEIRQSLTHRQAEEHPARWALVELENLHDDSQKFEPIHRLIKHTDVQALLAAAQEQIGAEEGTPLLWYSGRNSGVLRLDPRKGLLPVGVLQNFLDAYLAHHAGEIDYIHDDDALRTLASEEGNLGFLLPAIAKDQLFHGIAADGVLPRKTFSMGHAVEKRYYLEARQIR